MWGSDGLTLIGLSVLAQQHWAEVAPAQEQEPERGGWSFAVPPYFWPAGIDGKSGVDNEDADVEIKFSDLLKDFRFGACWSPKHGSLVSSSTPFSFAP
jgi:hypothetical protein